MNGANMAVCARLNAEQRAWLRSEVDRRRRAQVAGNDGIRESDRELFKGLRAPPSRRELDRRRRRGKTS